MYTQQRLKNLVTVLILISSAFFVLLPNSDAQAAHSPILLAATLGSSDTKQTGFNSSLSGGFSLSFDLKMIDLEVGYLALGRFDSENAADSDIEIDGITLSIAKGLHLFDTLHLDLKGGLFRWRADARFLSRNIGSDKGNGVWIGGGLRIQHTDFFGFIFGFERYFSVSGVDIERFFLGGSFRY